MFRDWNELLIEEPPRMGRFLLPKKETTPPFGRVVPFSCYGVFSTSFNLSGAKRWLSTQLAKATLSM